MCQKKQYSSTTKVDAHLKQANSVTIATTESRNLSMQCSKNFITATILKVLILCNKP